MKIQWLLLTVLCVLLAGSAIAQEKLTHRMTANVPFDFVVNDTKLPAGEYMVSTCDDGRKLMIQNKAHSEYTVFVLNTEAALSRHTDSDPKMIFILSKGQHVLHQISLKGDNHADDVVHSGHDVIPLLPAR